MLNFQRKGESGKNLHFRKYSLEKWNRRFLNFFATALPGMLVFPVRRRRLTVCTGTVMMTGQKKLISRQKMTFFLT